ncbi:TPA: hypothetical protein I9Y90_000067 [Elizabethkingia anophelis]|nr:hypothetical protein [Elizabethkingia anophelis]HAT4009590.1 hypothetical protein [Elizabethkingia anophelis]
MNTLEIYPPSEEELKQIIEELESKLDEAESPAEYYEYQTQLTAKRKELTELLSLKQ